jgi:hypothetical protein
VAEIVNLRRVRKDKTRREQAREADANRLRFGRTRVQKRADQDAQQRAERAHEDKKLEE